MEAAELALTASYLAGAGGFVALRGRHGFWHASMLGFAAAFALLVAAYGALAWGPAPIVLLALLYLGIIAAVQLLPLLLLLPLLHVALRWHARHRSPRTGP